MKETSVFVYKKKKTTSLMCPSLDRTVKKSKLNVINSDLMFLQRSSLVSTKSTNHLFQFCLLMSRVPLSTHTLNSELDNQDFCSLKPAMINRKQCTHDFCCKLRDRGIEIKAPLSMFLYF